MKNDNSRNLITEARHYMEAEEFGEAYEAYKAAASARPAEAYRNEVRDSLQLLEEWEGLSNRAINAENAVRNADREVGLTSGYGQEYTSARKVLAGLKLIGETKKEALEAYKSELSAMWRKIIAEQLDL